MDYLVDLLGYQSLSSSATDGIAYVGITGSQLPTGGGAVTVELYLSLDGVLDEQDYKLDSRTLTFSRNSSQTYSVNLDTSNLPIAEGSYTLIARAIPTAGESNTSNNQASLLVNHTNNDAIEIWISTALNAVESAGSKGNGVPPTTGTRLMALLSTAMLDTVAAFYPALVHYAQDLTAPVGTNLTAAIASTARTILRTILPGESAIIAAQYNKALREISATKSTIQRSTDFGANVANTAIAARAKDGSTDNTAYTPRTDQGNYVYQPPLDGEPNAGVALGANWGSVTRWVINRKQDQGGLAFFDPDGLQGRPGTQQFLDEIEEVREFGARSPTALTTPARTPDQSDIALFWACDRADTFRPYGQLFDIALDVADANPVPTGTGLTTNARLFAALSTALADSVITAWKWKYIEQQPRPWDLITGRIVPIDPITSQPYTGFTGYTIDRDWQSLLSQVNSFQSPPFPDYLSGHSAMGGAFASVMSAFFPTNPTFTASSQDLLGKVRTFGGSGTFDQYTYQNGFYLAGLEDALSRLYGGVHVREANIDSFNVGDKVGQFVATQFA